MITDRDDWFTSEHAMARPREHSGLARMMNEALTAIRRGRCCRCARAGHSARGDGSGGWIVHCEECRIRERVERLEWRNLPKGLHEVKEMRARIRDMRRAI
jgi:hypothetical protein